MADLDGWIPVDMKALGASAGLSPIATRKLLRSKWVAGEIDLRIERQGGHGAAYYVRAPSATRARQHAIDTPHLPHKSASGPTDEQLLEQYPDVDVLASGSFRHEADRLWYVQTLRRARAMRLQVPMGEHEDISAA